MPQAPSPKAKPAKGDGEARPWAAGFASSSSTPSGGDRRPLTRNAQHTVICNLNEF